MKLGNKKLILASGSPRRKELLEGLGLKFEIRLLKGIEESYPEGLSGEEIAKYISREKSAAYKETIGEEEIVITADTIVYLDGKVMGKPADREEAIAMLNELSGRTHEVITGVTFLTREKERTFASTSLVTFTRLKKEEIEYYVDSFEPLDKAGAYGIQEWIGYVGVERIEGSYFNVMGLPVQRLYKELEKFLEE